ncbi:MAG: patatin-like phospholipase family protein [Hyphomicrobiaceae bacterium]
MSRLPSQIRPKRVEPSPRIGLTLGGGGARGLAHIVALEAFDELKVRPAMISGSSIGAVIGSAYAAGLSAAFIRSLAEETLLTARYDLVRQLFSARSQPLSRVFQLLPARAAILDPEALLELILPKQVPINFEALDIPLRVAATDLVSSETVLFEHGPLRRAVAASMAIPVLFSPIVDGDRVLVDGGVTDPLPCDLVVDDVDVTVAIDVSGGRGAIQPRTSPSMVSTLAQTVQVLQNTIVRERLCRVKPDIYIDPELDDFGALQFHKVREILAASLPMRDRLIRQVDRVLTSLKV